MSSTEYWLVLEEAKRYTLDAQMIPKKYYDKKHSNPGKFKVNALVLKLDFKRKKSMGGKLKDRFVGPYIILSCLPHGVNKLQDTKGITIHATGSHFKIFHPNPSASISKRCKKKSVDDRPSEKDSESDQSVHEDSKGFPSKSGIFVDDPPSEEEDESSHSVHEDSKGLLQNLASLVPIPLMKTAPVPQFVDAKPGVRQDGVHVGRLVHFAESTAIPTEHV